MNQPDADQQIVGISTAFAFLLSMSLPTYIFPVLFTLSIVFTAAPNFDQNQISNMRQKTKFPPIISSSQCTLTSNFFFLRKDSHGVNFDAESDAEVYFEVDIHFEFCNAASRPFSNSFSGNAASRPCSNSFSGSIFGITIMHIYYMHTISFVLVKI